MGENQLFLTGVVLLACCAASRVPFWGALLPETLTRSARIGLFIPFRLQKQAFDTQEIKNPVQKRTGLLVVAGVGLEPTTFGL